MNIVLKEMQNNSSRVYGSSESQIIDVVNEMSWTISNKASRKDAPRMRLVEYQQTTGQLIASLIYFTRVLQNFDYKNPLDSASSKSDALDVYKLKYFGEKTGYEYSIPYFNPKNLSRTNQFSPSDPFSPLVQLGTSYGGGATSKAIAGFSTFLKTTKNIIDGILPGRINFELPQTWDNTSPETYSTTFDLINTTTLDDVVNNWKFCHLLSYQNTPSRRNFAIMDPPVIYSMNIPGVVNLPVCYMNDLQITNLGNTRIVNVEGVKRTVPEAYRITFSLTSLLLPSRNIMAATRDGSDVQVISDLEPWKNDAGEFLQQTNQVLTSIAKSLRPENNFKPQQSGARVGTPWNPASTPPNNSPTSFDSYQSAFSLLP